jgi:mevalonate kinase
MISAQPAARRTILHALDEAMDELDAALVDSDDNRLTEAMRRVVSLERQLGVLDGGTV